MTNHKQTLIAAVKNKKLRSLAVLAVAIAVSACSYAVGSDTYRVHDVNQIQRVERGVIESWRAVTVQTEQEVGKVVGIGVGAAAGADLGGRGSGGVIGAIIGALVGGAVGDSIDRSAGKKQGFDYIVVLDSGERISLVDISPEPIPVGAPVIIQVGGRNRIRLDISRIES